VLTHYHPGPSWNLYPTNGEYTEWAYRAHGTIAFTPELTGGCCTPDSSLYYGFVFPDDSVLVERVFRDNLPFARAVIDAEDADGGWTGWPRSSDALAGSWSWATPGNDTLLSPVVDLRGRSRVWLQFWTKHAGSTFTPENHGVVQFSADSGATWTDVARVE